MIGSRAERAAGAVTGAVADGVPAVNDALDAELAAVSWSPRTQGAPSRPRSVEAAAIHGAALGGRGRGPRADAAVRRGRPARAPAPCRGGSGRGIIARRALERRRTAVRGGPPGDRGAPGRGQPGGGTWTAPRGGRWNGAYGGAGPDRARCCERDFRRARRPGHSDARVGFDRGPGRPGAGTAAGTGAATVGGPTARSWSTWSARSGDPDRRAPAGSRWSTRSRLRGYRPGVRAHRATLRVRSPTVSRTWSRRRSAPAPAAGSTGATSGVPSTGASRRRWST